MGPLTPKVRLHSLLLTLGLCTALAGSAHATVVPAVGLDQLVSDAELIVRGEVTDVESRWSDDESTIYTYVTLSHVEVIHGKHSGPLTLRFEGGEIGGHRLEVDGMPQFRNGEEDILFVRGNQVAVSPVVGLFQGRFKVVGGLVQDDAGAPLISISDGTLVKLADGRPTEAPRGISLAAPAQVAYEYAKHPDHDRAEAALVAAAARSASGGRFPERGQRKGTGIDDNAGRSGAVAAPPQAVSGAAAGLAAPRPAALYVSQAQDTGRRLSAEAFIDAIRTRLRQ